MLAIMLLKASEPGRAVDVGGDVVDVVSDGGVVFGTGFKGGGRVPRPSLNQDKIMFPHSLKFK